MINTYHLMAAMCIAFFFDLLLTSVHRKIDSIQLIIVGGYWLATYLLASKVVEVVFYVLSIIIISPAIGRYIAHQILKQQNRSERSKSSSDQLRKYGLD